jgi:U6 snRNA-associated Sm-like protein LSm1
VLEDTVERIYHGNAFAENWHGLFLIRGENVVLLGEIVCSTPALMLLELILL